MELYVKQFIEEVRSGKSTELMNITGGYHYHTTSADFEDILDEIEKMLDARGYIAPEKQVKSGTDFLFRYFNNN